MPGPPARGRAGLSALLGRTARGLRRLGRLEVALAREGLREAAGRFGASAALGGGAAVLALFGLLFLLGAAAAGLALVLPVWLSLLVVGGALLALGAGLAGAAVVSARRASRRVTETAGQVRKDVRWLRERTS